MASLGLNELTGWGSRMQCGSVKQSIFSKTYTSKVSCEGKNSGACCVFKDWSVFYLSSVIYIALFGPCYNMNQLLMYWKQSIENKVYRWRFLLLWCIACVIDVYIWSVYLIILLPFNQHKYLYGLFRIVPRVRYFSLNCAVMWPMLYAGVPRAMPKTCLLQHSWM